MINLYSSWAGHTEGEIFGEIDKRCSIASLGPSRFNFNLPFNCFNMLLHHNNIQIFNNQLI